MFANIRFAKMSTSVWELLVLVLSTKIIWHAKLHADVNKNNVIKVKRTWLSFFILNMLL